MVRKITKAIVFLSLLLAAYGIIFAGWLIYHKPGYHGRVLDAETKAPIEGAVVVAVYERKEFAFIESNSDVFHVRETLTDKNGEFRIPLYITLIHPFSWGGWVDFRIYKPGYGNYPNQHTSPPSPGVSPEKFFSMSKELGTKGTITWITETIPVTFGVVELKRLKTREERLRAWPSAPADYRSRQLPLLFKAMNEEARRFGLEEER